MPKTFFNLDNPFERKVSERLDEYLKRGLPHDMVLDMIGRDFPCMDAEVMDHCETTAYLHYHSGQDGKIAGTFKRVALLHSKFNGEPFYSHMGYKFHLRKGEDLLVAVQVENPLYLYDKADVHLTFHIDGRQVNEFRHTMAIEERRNVYYVPLNILENVECPAETYAMVKIDVVDENIAGNIHSIETDIYFGETDPADVFEMVDFKLCYGYEDRDKEVFDLGKADSLYLAATVRHNRHYGHIRNIDGIVTISPSDSSDRRDTLVSTVYLSDSSVMDGCIDSCGVLCNIAGMFSNEGNIPFFKPEPGRYTINFFLLDALLYSREIEFIGSYSEGTAFDEEEEISEEEDSDDFEKLLDYYIQKRLAEIE